MFGYLVQVQGGIVWEYCPARFYPGALFGKGIVRWVDRGYLLGGVVLFLYLLHSAIFDYFLEARFSNDHQFLY